MISVIVPVYNSEQYLNECIRSILCQSYQDFELIIIDDGSTDNSREIAYNWTLKDQRVVLICQQNSGASSARNHGLSIAKGEYVVFIDSDDYVKSSYLQDLLDTIADNKNVALGVTGHSVYYNEKLSYIQQFPKCNYQVGDYHIIFKELSLHKFGFPWGKIFRKDIINKHHLRFDEKVCIAEDMMFLMRYLISANSMPNAMIAFSDVCNYNYCIREGSLSTSCSSFDNELYSLNEYKNIINSIWSVFNINDISIKYTMMSPVSFYMDRCLNSIFQRPVSSNWRKQLKMINRDDYQKYKKCNTSFESLLKYLFVHRFWFLLYLLRR